MGSVQKMEDTKKSLDPRDWEIKDFVGCSKDVDGWKIMPKPIIGSRGISVIVPCYEEAENLKELTTRLFKATRGADLNCELILVDDYSGKGTEDTRAVVESLQAEGYEVQLLVRMPNEGKGLSSAVVYGMDRASHDTLVVMDADLQHEPESVPHIAAPIMEGVSDFAIGSRNVGGAKLEDWPLHRQLISWFATMAALPLTACSDPMSGFFSLSKQTYLRGRPNLNPMGYKIGLELLVRCGCSRVQEIPITFHERQAGESKLDVKQTVLYLQHLAHLYIHKVVDHHQKQRRNIGTASPTAISAN